MQPKAGGRRSKARVPGGCRGIKAESRHLRVLGRRGNPSLEELDGPILQPSVGQSSHKCRSGLAAEPSPGSSALGRAAVGWSLASSSALPGVRPPASRGFTDPLL